MEAKDIDLNVTENAVYISGERKTENKTEENGTTRSEFHYGKFQRVIPLPARIQNTNVTAEYKERYFESDTTQNRSRKEQSR